ncbi:MAG: RNA polymerase sigma factor RpoD/SigA [Minisyncoccia bacterium]
MKLVPFDEIGAYLDDIADSEPLTREEEAALAARIAAGDIDARNELVKANLRFAVSVAMKYQNRGLTLAELISAGNLGLITAADRFDGTRGFKFISYAVWWIRQAIQQALAEDSRAIRVPVNKIALFNRIARSFVRLQKAGVANPGTQEIADDLGEKEDEVILAITSNSPISSSDDSYLGSSSGKASNMGEGQPTLLEMSPDESSLSPDDSLACSELQAQVQAALECLDEREALILKRYFGLDGQEPLTLEAIGQAIGLTRERVRQLKERALHNLRYPSKTGLLVSLIGGDEAVRLKAATELRGRYVAARQKAQKKIYTSRGSRSSLQLSRGRPRSAQKQ